MRSCLKFAGVAALALMVAACSEQNEGAEKQAAAPQQQPATQVGTVTLEAQTVGLVEEMPGRTIAFRQADIRPQVDGIIKERNFTEGTFVEAGQQLYMIDQDVYLAKVDAAQAELARQIATFDQATKTRKRYDPLIKSQAVSQQTYDDAVAAEAQGKAAVAAARAELEQARIDLAYTTVTAPISGQIGSSDFTEGALVTANQTAKLTTITQLDPIYVDVTQAGGRLMKIKQAIQNGRIKGVENGQVEVSLIIDSTGAEYPHKGTLQFSDVTVNETTGTIRLRVVFPNPDGTLLPGMFVRGQVRQGHLENAFLVPQKAVMRRPDGSAYVYVVVDGKVASKDITIEQSQGQNWLVSAGVEDGDQLIVDGLQRIGPGAPVAAQPVETAKAAE
ncbi:MULTISPECIES: efflux RND transporter periplasmic adaptor subunit [Thalassospira]|jgi:membrane fusion protein (multidrug efflux system)|uniref:Efflux RND transporter periplasmic adaptor subunit n=1 Tax=Thalassospira povalilytica TaxID=732237 RepID=A0A8I1MAG5_9PROT|nr:MULTISPECIES: efflux RND transporter periplasmic adaptor subunit [Thalassospira]MEE3045021.1 efflux RND transporter periplasmic adaptor subunit [Pseudomonadota bacterium]RCK24646.1 multidrug transporter [Thalassospira profundimaris]KZB65999.1 efflux transporter periplasmic adaptor subunit [Thalassospira sp. MCCC 1A02491]MBN8197719.1 efflux RND transporter periplasmic adaptor subunit [Thalassospira povalilytica]PKR48623.1 efflux RND transporter periplasmic adaptor subunit [Thalassospira pova